MRIYVPATLPMLSALVSDAALRPVNGTAFAVTPGLREAYASGDDDELAEVALREAALASLRLLAMGEPPPAGAGAADPAPGPGADPAGAPVGGVAGTPGTGPPVRRAVLVADVADARATVRPDLDDAVVRVSGPIDIDSVVAAYVDTAAAQPAVTAAVAVIDEADLGDEDAELTVGDAEDHDMAWYAPQELPFLLDLL